MHDKAIWTHTTLKLENYILKDFSHLPEIITELMKGNKIFTK